MDHVQWKGRSLALCRGKTLMRNAWNDEAGRVFP